MFWLYYVVSRLTWAPSWNFGEWPEFHDGAHMHADRLACFLSEHPPTYYYYYFRTVLVRISYQFITLRLFCSPLPIEFSCHADWRSWHENKTKSLLGASARDNIWVAALQPVLCWGAAGRDQAEVLNTRRRPDPRHFLCAHALPVPINGIRELLQFICFS